jgi:hypothetical protein
LVAKAPATVENVTLTRDVALQSETFFKLVAVEPDGRYVSIFDGTTEYAIGSTLSKEVRAGHKGGLYVCESVLDLLKQGPLPSRSARLDAPWAVAQLVGWGQKLRYDLASGGAKFALENLVCALHGRHVACAMATA